MHIRPLSPWAQETSILLLSQGSVLAATFALSVLIARQLGPAEFGVFTACLGGALAAAVLADAGLGRWLLRELSAVVADADAEEMLFRASALLAPAVTICVVAASVLVAAAAAVGLLAGFSHSVTIALVLLVAYTALVSLATLLETVFRAQRWVSAVALATVFEKVVLAAGVATALGLGARIELVALAFLLSGAARVAFDHVRLTRLGLGLRRPCGTPVREALRASMPFFFSALAFTAVTRTDPVVIAASSTQIAGYYGVGERMLSVLVFVPFTATTALLPHVSGRGAATHAGIQMTAALAGVCSLLAIGTAAAAPGLVPALYGTRFEESIILVQLMVAALPAIAIANGLTVTLFARRRERLAMWINLSLMVLGSAGLALGTELGEAAGAGIAYLLRAWLVAAMLLAATVLVRPRSLDDEMSATHAKPRA